MNTENPSTLIPFSVMDSIAAIAAEKAQRNARLISEARKVDAKNAKRRESMTLDEVIADGFDF